MFILSSTKEVSSIIDLECESWYRPTEDVTKRDMIAGT